MDRSYNIEAVMAAIDAVKLENRRLYQQNEQLRGKLKEARRAANRMQKEIRTGRYSASYVRQLIVASVGMAVAFTCLLHSMALAGVF